MNSKKLLALLLAATLLAGSLCGPVFAARAGQTAGAEFLEEIPPETIFTEKTDASAEGEAAGEYSTALETAAEEPAGTADPEAPDASMDQSMDQSSEQTGENSLDAFSDGADLLEEPGDPSQQAEDDAVEAPSEETDPAEDTEESPQQPEDIVVEDPSEETDLTEDSGDSAQQPEDIVVEDPSEETDLAEDMEDSAQQPEDSVVEDSPEEMDLQEDSEDPAQTAEDAAEVPSEETDTVEDPAQQPEDDAVDVPSEETDLAEDSTQQAEDPEDSAQQPEGEAGRDLPAEDGTEVLPEDGLIEDQDQAEIAEEEAMAGILEGETALNDQILQDDMTIDGDAYLSSGIFDLNGHTLTINGSLVQPGGAMQINGGYLEVTGDYRIQYRNDNGTYRYGDGVLVMTNENDYVKVGGELYVSGFRTYRDRDNNYVENTLTAGTLEIGAGLHQDGRNEAFRARDAHRTLITGAGDGQQASVSFDSPDSWMGILEAGDGASIDWTGYFNVQKLGGDVQIHTPAEEGDGISVYSNNGRMDFGGHTLTVDGNVKTVVGKLYVGGADLAGGDFDPEAGGAFTINGNLLQPEGAVIADGGRIAVTGDYRIQYRNNDGTYRYGDGVLVMTNENDYVKVGGELYVSGFRTYRDRNNSEVTDTLTAGTLEIGAGLHQDGRNEAFRAQDAHRTLIIGAGAGQQASVSFDSPDSWMGILEAGDGASIDWEGYFNVQKLGGDVQIHTPAEEGDGISVYSNNGRMDFGGHTLTIDGNVKTVVGGLYVGGADLAGENFDPEAAGALTINGNLLQPEGAVIADGGRIAVSGDYRIQYRKDDGTYRYGDGVLVMTNENDYVKVGGELYVSGFRTYRDRNNSEVTDTLTAGTLEIGAGLHQNGRNEAFRAQDAHRTLITGAGAEKKASVSFDSPDSWMGILEAGDGASIDWTGYFNVQKLGCDVEIRTPAEEGDGISVYSSNGRMNFDGHTLTVDGNIKTVVGKLYVGGADLAGENFDPEAAGALTINGNLLQPEGAVIADGGRITVTGDYRIQYRNNDGTYRYGDGVLVMTNENDYVKVGGEIYVSGFHYFRDRNDVYVGNTLTAGTLELEGNFCQNGRNEAFRASGSHKTILRGDGAQAVQMESSDSWFNILDLKNDLSEYIFSRFPCWAVLTRNGEPVGDEAVAAIPYTASVNEKDKTLTILSWKDESAEIVIPDQLNGYTVTGIGREVFRNRTSLEEITLPSNLTEIGEAAFRGCTALTGIEFPVSLREIGSHAFRDCTSLTTVTFAEGSSLETIRNSAFENDKLLESVAIPEGTSKIGEYAFYGCSALKKVTMPGTVNEMGIQVFRNTALRTAGPAGSGCDYEFGWTQSVPAYGFDWIDTLTDITLTDSITTLGRNAIAECRSLKWITLPQSLTEVGVEVFSGCESLQSIDFPEGITLLPENALQRCTSLTDVTLPGSLTRIGRYAFGHCDSLTILEIPEGVTTLDYHAFYDCALLAQIVVPDSVTTIDDQCFQKIDDTKPTLYVIPGSYAEEYAQAKGLYYEYATNLGHTVSARVTGSGGEVLTGGYSVCWYLADEDIMLGTGAKLRNVAEGTGILCRVILDEELGTVYELPEDVFYTVSNKDGTVEIALIPFGRRAVTGTVKDSDGNPVQGASVQLRQIYNEIFEKTSETESDETGGFSFDADRTRAVLTVSAEGYYDEIYAVSGTNQSETAAIEAVLQKVPADKITLPLARLSAAAEGEEPVVTVLQNANGLTFSAYNETQDREVRNLRVQYPYLILSDGSSAGAPVAGDVIRITITDRTGKLADGEVRVTLDENRCGSASWTLVENGSIRFTGITLSDEDAQKAAIMVFDSTGHIVETGNAEHAYTTGQLPAGNYTAVLMEKTSLLTSVDNLARFAEVGLSEETDFVKKNVSVEEGVIRVLGDITLPDFEESKLYYTVENNTRVWAGSSRTATGQYVTMRAMYEIADQYSTSGETVLLEIPAGMAFVEGSLTVNGRPGTCTVTDKADGGSSVAVPVNTAKGTIRFYLLPASAGTKKLHAYLSFTNENGTESAQEVTQPIGTAEVEVSAATISVPDETGFRQVTASGRAIANCQITVYDNGTAVGTTTSKKNGSWSLEFELVRPMKFSFHEIYAEVKSTDYDVDIETDIAELLYNINYVEVSKVTMINTAHPNDSLKPTEFTTVFDFLHPSSAVPTYNYWPSYPTFTFLVEFTGGDADVLSNVSVVTTDSSGERTYVPCTYDETGRVWVGTYDYRTFSDVPCKVTVSCDNWSGDGYDDSMEAEDMVDMLANAVYLGQNMSTRLGRTTAGANEVFGDETISFDLTADGEKIADYKLEMLDFEEFDLEAWAADNYMEFEDKNGSISYQTYNLTDDTYTIRTAYPDERLYAKETLKLSSAAGVTGTAFGGTDGFRPSRAESAVYRGTARGVTLKDWAKAANRLNEPGLSIKEYLEAVAAYYEITAVLGAEGLIYVSGQKECEEVFKRLIGDWEGLLKNARTLKKHLDRMERVVKKKNCKCLSDDYMKNPLKEYKKKRDAYIQVSLSYACGAWAADSMMARCGGLARTYASFYGKGANQKQAYRFIRRQALEKGARTMFMAGTPLLSHDALKKLTDQYVAKFVNFGDNTWNSFFSSINVRKTLAEAFQKLDREIREETEKYLQAQCPCGKNCKCDHEEPKEDPEKKKEQEVVPKADPSGYVYEAVPSNRVGGVKAEIYYYDYAVDEFGMKEDEKSEILWDAENYDQINPQYTDAYGTFAWDVPEGQWLVKFSKDGYEDADSYNDTAATSVGQNGKHYLPVPPIQTEVNTAMVSTAAPEVAGVSAYEGEIDIDFSQYMQISTVNTTNVTVSAAGGTAISGTIEPLNAEDNYDGTAQYASSFAFRPAETAGTLSGTVTVAVKNVKNYAGTAIAAAYSGQHTVTVMPRSLEITGETGMLHHDSTELTIRVLPAEAGAGRTLTITSYSPSIVSAAHETVTTDENGLATVTLNGNLPGQGILEIALEGTKIAEEQQITVTARQAAPTIRSLEDGNAAVTLETEGLTYDGREKKPAVRVSYDGSDLEEGTDYTVVYSNNIKAGTDTAKVTVTGTGLYEGTLEQTFSIARAALVSADVTLASGTYTYNGKSQKPAVTVKHGGKKLASGTDYSVTYSDNVHAGTASVKVAGKGNYKGTVTKKFTIAKAAQSIKLTVDATKIAVGKSTAVKVSGTKGSISFKSASDSLATVKKKDSKTGTVKAVKVGKVKITVTAAKTSDFNAVSKAVTISVVPAATSTFKAENQAAGIKLTWKKVAGANAYIIYRGSTQIAAIKNGSTVTYTDKKANTNGTKYTYKIIASASSTGRSTLSKSVTTYCVARPAISALTNSGAKKMTVKWGKNAKATGYQIQYSTDKTFKTGTKSVTISSASTVAKAITGLTKGKTYYVRIRTFKTAGSTKYFSAWCAVKSVKITK